MGFQIHLLQKANDPDLNFLQAFPLLLESLYSSQLSNSSIQPLLPQPALQPLKTLMYLIRYKFHISNQVWLFLAFLAEGILPELFWIGVWRVAQVLLLLKKGYPKNCIVSKDFTAKMGSFQSQIAKIAHLYMGDKIMEAFLLTPSDIKI